MSALSMSNEAIEKINNSIPAIELPEGAVKVARASLVQALSLPANGATETNLYAHKGVTMHYHTSGLYCEYKNEQFIVPLANVVAVFRSYNKGK